MVDQHASLRSAHDAVAIEEQSSGAEQWTRLSDDLLSGLVHALNNRVTALGAWATLGALGDAEALEGGALSGELTRLQRVSALLRLLSMRRTDAEALQLAPVLDDAMALHEHYPRTRAVTCTVVCHGMLQPVRTPRWALLRAMVVLLNAGTIDALKDDARSITVTLQGDGASVCLRVRARGDAGPYAREMAALCGGVISRDGEELVLTLPSLLSLRDRERARNPLG